MSLRPLERAYRKCGKLYTQLRDLETVVADLDDSISDQLLEQAKLRVGQLGHHLSVRLEEQAARGLGDPAVTDPAPGGPHLEPCAGESVGRGRTKARLRT